MFLKKGTTSPKYLLILIILAVIIGGGILVYQLRGEKEEADYNNIEIVYFSGNPSLPPPYGLMNTLTISSSATGQIKAEYEFNNEGILKKKPITVSFDQLEKLVKGVLELKPADNSLLGCTGGSSQSIKISQAGKTLLEVSAYYCAGKTNNESLDKLAIEIQKILSNSNKDKTSCEALGGSWGRIGLDVEESCNLPTSDAGKECLNSTDCEGSCIAELSKEDWDKLWSKVMGEEIIIYTKGKCTPWKVTVGCHAFVEDGKVEWILCVD